MHKKYDRALVAFNEGQHKTELSSIEREMEKGVARQTNAEIIKDVMHIGDIIKAMGCEKYSPSLYSDNATVWCFVNDQDQIKAINMILWTFGFKYVSGKEDSTTSIDIRFERDGYTIAVYHYFTDAADCKLVEVGTREIPVYERQCGESGEPPVKVDLEDITAAIGEAGEDDLPHEELVD